MTISDHELETTALDRRVHAVLHCNVNTPVLAESADFLTRLGLVERMRSVSDDTDGRPLGLGEHTSSITAFHYDGRGPRSAPAIELVGWREPPVAAREVATKSHTLGFEAIGLRTPQPAALSPGDTDMTEVVVRGRRVAAWMASDPAGGPVELIHVDPSAVVDEPEGAKFSHVRLVSSDLERTAAWWQQLGFEPVPNAPAGALSLVAAEDPTFSIEFRHDPGAVRPDWHANTAGLYRIALAVEDVVRAHHALLDLGADIPEPVFIPMVDTPTGGFTVLFLADPDGAVVELVSRPRSEVRRPAQPC
ncbi:VOC family protein [Gordonia rubripertincta]|uniref:VOC family protein n=1 Tax=Gordonia rubripertincta TaxID=36822 RepID=UPI000B8D28D6|nr:VOC family protein [Gordonia rubripertincta]ASR03139.1 Glyoxalase-like domain protein [Gordonia rubripertincta]